MAIKGIGGSCMAGVHGMHALANPDSNSGWVWIEEIKRRREGREEQSYDLSSWLVCKHAW